MYLPNQPNRFFWGGGILNKTEYPKQLENENVELAIYIEDEKTNSIPTKESGYYYDLEKSSCNNEAYINWDSVSWSPVVKNVTTYPTRCELHFTKTYTEGILNGADPIIKDELIPVTIENDGTVKKADLETPWYSYADKKWANAVILKDDMIYDLSGNNYNGTLMNGTEIITDSEGNKAISFDGIDDYVDIADITSETNFADGFTIEFEATWKSLNAFSRIMDFSDSEENYVIYITNSSSDTKANIIIGGRNRNSSDSSLNTAFADQIVANEKAKYKFEYVKEENEYKIKYYKNDNLISTVNKGNISFQNTLYTDNYLGKSTYYGNNLDELFNGLIYNIKITDASGNTILWYDLNNELTLMQPEYEADGVIPESVIESYFVWIPKYRYQLWDLGQYDNLTEIDESKIHEIPIVFGDYNTSDSKVGECTTPMESGATGNCQIGDYMTHPAFLSIPSTGFWVGKFETGYDGASSTSEAEANVRDASKIIVKPNVYSWRGIQVANAFYTSYDYKRNLDSHMMKNTEWGAVAYLQHSKYGSATSVRINNNSDYITGYQASKEPTCGWTMTNEECNKYCNDNTCNAVYPNTNLASTTGNISGIFDMSGGAWEYVMAVMVDENGNPMSGGNSQYNSGFNGMFGCPTCDNDSSGLINLTDGYSFPLHKYYDVYNLANVNSDYERRILGDATGEIGSFDEITYLTETNMIGSWYDNHAMYLVNSMPWFFRGGAFVDGINSGVFAFAARAGCFLNDTGFRLILVV